MDDLIEDRPGPATDRRSPATDRRIAPTGRLRIGTGVILRDLREEVFRSRVESWFGSVLTVVKPMGVPAAYPYPPGTAFDLLWTEASGLHVLPVELARSRAERRVRLWDLIVVGEPWIDQRREFVRVPAFGRLSLAVGETEFHGYLVDVSEAAMQCSVWAEADDPALRCGAAAAAEFTAHGAPFRRTGTVYGVRPAAESNETLVVIRFSQTDGEAKELRREVFAAQVDMRRTWRRQQQESVQGNPEPGGAQP